MRLFGFKIGGTHADEATETREQSPCQKVGGAHEDMGTVPYAGQWPSPQSLAGSGQGTVPMSSNEKMEIRSEEKVDDGGVQVSADILRFIGESISKEAVLGIPAVASPINLIATTCANINFKLYKRENGKLKEVEDERENIVNNSTGDMLNGFEMKRALVRDYLLSGSAYIYKDMELNRLKGLYYVDEECVYAAKNEKPIFKRAVLLVDAKQYMPEDFIILARNTKDGVTGEGILSENDVSLRLISNILKYISKTAAGGGAKRGFFSAKKKLSKESMTALREAIDIFFSTENPRPIVLNEGVDYQSEVQTAAEQQIREIYSDISGDICEILLVPKCILDGTATNDAFRNWFRSCIIPILNEMSAAFNHSLLLEREKGDHFWKADTTEIENGDLKAMFEAYSVASQHNILDLDEIREKLGYEPRGFNFIRLGLADVLYDPKTNTVYTPNTNMVQDMDGLKKGTDITPRKDTAMKEE